MSDQVFVTVLRSLHVDNRLRVEEEQDIVFREAAAAPASAVASWPPRISLSDADAGRASQCLLLPARYSPGCTRARLA